MSYHFIDSLRTFYYIFLFARKYGNYTQDINPISKATKIVAFNKKIEICHSHTFLYECFFISFLLFVQLGGHLCNILGIIKISCQVYEITLYIFKKNML